MRASLLMASVVSLLVLSPAGAWANNDKYTSGSAVIHPTPQIPYSGGKLVNLFRNTKQILKNSGEAKNSSKYARTASIDATRFLSRTDVLLIDRQNFEEDAQDSYERARTDNLALHRMTGSLVDDLKTTAGNYARSAENTNDSNQADHLNKIAKALRVVARSVNSAHKNYGKAHPLYNRYINLKGYLSTDVANDGYKAAKNADRSLIRAHDKMGKLIDSVVYESGQ